MLPSGTAILSTLNILSGGFERGSQYLAQANSNFLTLSSAEITCVCSHAWAILEFLFLLEPSGANPTRCAQKEAEAQALYVTQKSHGGYKITPDLGYLSS